MDRKKTLRIFSKYPIFVLGWVSFWFQLSLYEPIVPVGTVLAPVCGNARGGWYLLSGTRLGRQIWPEESIPTPLQQSTKSLPVAFLSSFDPWSTLPINRAQLWPLTWPPSPGCCRLTSPLEQQREEITSDIASARCPKPLPHIAAASSLQTEKTAPSGPHGIFPEVLQMLHRSSLSCLFRKQCRDTKLFLEIKCASIS